MIKLKTILLEIVSPNIVVGLVDDDLNVVSRNNIATHSDLYELHPEWKTKHSADRIHWRYNAENRTTYWYQNRTDEQQEAVKEELKIKYRFNVRANAPIGNRMDNVYMQRQLKAHGMSESIFPPKNMIRLKFILDEIKKELKNVNETMSFKDLYNISTPERIQRSKSDVRVRPLRVVTLDENEAWTFSYKSNPSVTGKPHKGYIKFFKEHVEQGENAEDLDCIVDCTCPDFMYRYAYNDTRKDASVVGPKSWSKCINRAPKPAYNFGEGMCKHLLALQGYLKTKIQPTQTRSNLFETLNGMMGKHFDVNYND